jgi:hypothetical protein
MSKTPGLLTNWAAVQEFLFAGNATMTLRSRKTGDRYTFKVRIKKADAGLDDPVYFVNLLRGPDNTGDFTYMGVLRRPGSFHLTGASKVGRTAGSFKAMVWFLDAMRCTRDVLTTTVEVWHEGRCGRCGRKLTVPESVARGLGDDCANKAA